MAPVKPRLLVLNQYYWPGVEATANLLTDLCEALADEFDVRVVTGVLHGHEDEPRELERNGVRIERVASTAYERSQLPRRAANYVTYLAGSLATALRGPRPDVVLCMTDPPMVGDIGLAAARRFDAPLLVISMDVFPEIAVELKRLENPAAVALLRSLVGLYLKRADRVVAIGETMRRRLEEKGTPPDRLVVIPNWVDTSAITPQPRDNEWARENHLDEPFVVMHSGNVGHAQDLDTLVRAEDVPPRSRRPRNHHRRLRRTLRRGPRPQPATRRVRSLQAVPAARGAGAVALERRRPLRRARARALGLRRPESALRDPRGWATGDRRRRRRERDCERGARGRLRRRHPAGPAGAACRRDP